MTDFTGIDNPIGDYHIPSMQVWPPLVLPLDPTGRLAAIQELAESDTTFRDWGSAMLEHVQKNTGLGWPLAVSLQRASAECRSHLPPTMG